MDKDSFLKILCSSSVTEINELIASKGKLKTVNAVTFLSDEYINQQNQKDKNGK